MSKTLKDYPGMAHVCMFHAMAYERDGDTTWREGGHAGCLCERIEGARARLNAEAAWARQDERKARERAVALEAEAAALGHFHFTQRETRYGNAMETAISALSVALGRHDNDDLELVARNCIDTLNRALEETDKP